MANDDPVSRWSSDEINVETSSVVLRVERIQELLHVVRQVLVGFVLGRIDCVPADIGNTSRVQHRNLRRNFFPANVRVPAFCTSTSFGPRTDIQDVLVALNGRRISVYVEFPPTHPEIAEVIVSQMLVSMQCYRTILEK